MLPLLLFCLLKQRIYKYFRAPIVIDWNNLLTVAKCLGNLSTIEITHRRSISVTLHETLIVCSPNNENVFQG